MKNDEALKTQQGGNINEDPDSTYGTSSENSRIT